MRHRSSYLTLALGVTALVAGAAPGLQMPGDPKPPSPEPPRPPEPVRAPPVRGAREMARRQRQANRLAAKNAAIPMSSLSQAPFNPRGDAAADPVLIPRFLPRPAAGGAPIDLTARERALVRLLCLGHTDQWHVGDPLVWSPEVFDAFCDAHAELIKVGWPGEAAALRSALRGPGWLRRVYDMLHGHLLDFERWVGGTRHQCRYAAAADAIQRMADAMGIALDGQNPRHRPTDPGDAS